MDYYKNLSDLRIIMRLDTKLYHSFTDNAKLFPFQSRSENKPNYKKVGFKKIIAEFSRVLNDEAFNGNISIDEIVNNLNNNDKLNCNEISQFRAFLIDYLFTESDELNIIHPTLYKYESLSDDKTKSGEKDVAIFFRDVMFNDIPEIKNYFDFSVNESLIYNDIITNMILDNLPKLNDKKVDSEYIPLLPHILNIFKKDMLLALKYDEFFLNNIENLFAYYYFFYITQLALKLCKPLNSLDNIEKLYYLVDSEVVNGSRETITTGFGLIESFNYTLIDKVYLITYINILLGTKGLLMSELDYKIKNLPNNEYNEFIEVFKIFIEEYIDGIKQSKYYQKNKKELIFEYELNNDYENLKVVFFKWLQTKDPSIADRYYLSLVAVADKYFIKNGGQHGKVLNINQDMLLSITALCIGENEKILRNDLFKEYERRGLFFDKKSRRKIDEILSKLDLVDKKSDSGDVQYVRRIL